MLYIKKKLFQNVYHTAKVKQQVPQISQQKHY